jgi:hypothetical protein
MHRLKPPRWSSRLSCGRPIHSIDCPGRLTVRRLAQPALEHQTVARRTRSHRRSRTAGSAAAPRSSSAAASGLSSPVPLHGTIPRQPSQRSHASRKCMAQLSLGSRRRQGHLSTTRTNRSATAVNMHAVIAGVRHWDSSPLGRWEHVSSPMHRRHRLCRTVCKKRLQGQLDPSAGSPGRSRRHIQRRLSHLPGHPVSEP